MNADHTLLVWPIAYQPSLKTKKTVKNPVHIVKCLYFLNCCFNKTAKNTLVPFSFQIKNTAFKSVQPFTICETIDSYIRTCELRTS